MKLDSDQLKEKAEELHEEYGINRQELGKILFIVSTTLLIFSAHAALTFQSAAEKVDDSNSQLEEASAIINSDSFQRSVDSLENLKGTSISNSLQTVAASMDSAQAALKDSQDAQDNLEEKTELYQWIALIAILGDVAAVAIIYS